jgi:hypothetical protein
MTVAVDTPDGVKRGSAVYEVRNDIRAHAQYHGEAVVVDLGKRGKLFAIMLGSDGYTDFEHIMTFDAFPSRGNTPIGTSVRIKTSNYPMLVHFKDLARPETIERIVPPNESTRSAVTAEDAFGKGVAIKEVSLEITTEPMTKGIEHDLPWLSKYYGLGLDGKEHSGSLLQLGDTASLKNFLGVGWFSTELSPPFSWKRFFQ